MGVLSAFMMYKEKSTFYIGLEKDPAGVVSSVLSWHYAQGYVSFRVLIMSGVGGLPSLDSALCAL